MRRNRKNNDGFTLIEILVSVFVMSIGFLAYSQMQILSIKQQKIAQTGSTVTNIIQVASDFDMTEMKRYNQYNANALLAVIGSKTAELDYCNGMESTACTSCPCNPLLALTDSPPTAGSLSTSDASCAVIGLNSTSLTYRQNSDDCITDYNSIIDDTEPFFIVRVVDSEIVTTTFPNIINITVNYVVQDLRKFQETTLVQTDFNISDTLDMKTIEYVAHIDNFSDIIAGWGSVVVPDIP